MESRESFNRIKSYIVLILSIVMSFIIINGLNLSDDIKSIQIGMQMLILGSLVFGLLKKDEVKLLRMIIFIGIVMRIGYMLYTPIDVRAHDLGGIDGAGHMRYIIKLMQNQLPISNEGQFYHPPLFHYLSAQICKIVNLFFNRVEIEAIVEASKIVSCFASCSVLILTKRICEELKLGEKAKLIVVAFIAFLPNFYLLAGRVNNDSLALFFMIVIVLYTIKWYIRPLYRNVIILAIAFGLGMMTKLSVGMMALYTGSIMLYVLFKDTKGIKRQTIFLELIVFGMICFPLALWYPIRNKILFGQELTYVLQIPVEHALYCGEYKWYQRFIGFPFNKALSQIYNSPYEDYNVNVYLFKSALFGEFTFEINNCWSVLILITYIILMILVALSYLYLVYKYRKTKAFMTYTICSVTAIMYISYIYFNVKYPFGCSMDYRYIAPMALMNSLVLGIGIEGLKEIKSKVGRYIKSSTIFIFIAFVVLSVIMFCNIGATSIVLGS